jgi:hemin uptake protein HemP
MSVVSPRAPTLHLVARRTEPRNANVPAVPRVASALLLAGGRELVIQHQGSEYHLRLTRNDKLILTK